MEESTPSTRDFTKLLLAAALIGILAGTVTLLFITLVNLVIEFVWDSLPDLLGFGGEPSSFYIFTIAVLGGLSVGLLVRFFGEKPAILAELMAEFGKTGRIEYKDVPGVVLTAFVSLVSGGALGPEAALMDATGGMGTWLAERAKAEQPAKAALTFSGLSGMLGAYLSSTFAAPILILESSTGSIKTLFLIPGIVAAAAGIAAYMFFGGEFLSPIITFSDPYEQVHLIDLVYAIPLGLLGGLAGLLYIAMYQGLRRTLLIPLAGRPVIRGLIGGLGLGIVGAVLPITLFSGEGQIEGLITNGAQLGVGMLLIIALAKMFLTNLALTTGWKGGYIFPVLFAGSAIGVAIDILLPIIPQPVAVTAILASFTVAVLRSPIFVVLLIGMLTEHTLVPAMSIAMVVSYWLTRNWSLVPREEQPAEGENETAETGNQS
jgi:H+/Cl- antiporter ClcA